MQDCQEKVTRHRGEGTEQRIGKQRIKKKQQIQKKVYPTNMIRNRWIIKLNNKKGQMKKIKNKRKNVKVINKFNNDGRETKVTLLKMGT